MAQDGETVEVEEPEELVARVAAIDVAKASGMVCTRVPHPAKPGRRAPKGWQVPATTNASIELAEQLAWQGIQRVVVESTADLLAGLAVPAASPRPGGVAGQAPATPEHLPGRPKTDKLDAVWLARRNERACCGRRLSPGEIRRLRDSARLRSDLTQGRARQVQRREQAAGWTP